MAKYKLGLEEPPIDEADNKTPIIDPTNELFLFSPRITTTRFANLHDDEKIVAHLGLTIKEMYRSCLEAFYEYSLDDIQLEQQIKCLTQDGYGGVNYFNYMFSDSYDDEDKCTDRPMGEGMEYYAKLSIYDALEKYGQVNIGDLIVTPEMMAFVKEQRSIGRIPDGNIIRDEKRYELMKQAAEAVVNVDKNFAGHPIMCLAGGFAGEMGWKFDEVIINEEERDHGKNGTLGMENCGEGWIGYTFWTSKSKWIQQYNLPCPRDKDGYIAAGANLKKGMKLSSLNIPQGRHIIASLPIEQAAKLVVAYMQDRKSAGPWIARWPENKDKPGAANEAMGASFMSKHGEGFAKQCNTWWDKAVYEGRREIHSSVGVIKRSGFGCHVYMSMMFARYIKDGKVPKGDPWDP